MNIWIYGIPFWNICLLYGQPQSGTHAAYVVVFVRDAAGGVVKAAQKSITSDRVACHTCGGKLPAYWIM